jgi:prevent-host-death family protein
MTEGVSQIASITELRSETAEVLEAARAATEGVMIQKNNEPQAALISWDLYKKLKAAGVLDAIRESGI